MSTNFMTEVKLAIARKKLLLVLSLLLSVCSFMMLLRPVQAAPATFVVTNINGSGAGSLAQAIINANTNNNPADQDIIEFNIPTNEPKLIQPAAGSLNITQSVLINGATQAGYRANTTQFPLPFDTAIRVELDNSISGGFDIRADNVTIQALATSLSNEGQIKLHEVNNFKLFGSYINTDHLGIEKDPYDQVTPQNVINISGSSNVNIGGGSANERNIIGNCTTSCIYGEGSGSLPTTNLKIQGNYFGVGFDGTTSLNTFGNTLTTGIVLVDGVEDALIGGSGAGQGNSIERFNEGGIRAEDVAGLTVMGNRILQLSRSYSDSNEGVLYLGGVTDATIGANSSFGRNIIAGVNTNNTIGIGIGDSTVTNQNSSNVVIEGNYLGLMDDGTTAFEIDGSNIQIGGSSQNVLVRSNRIKNSLNGSGVAVVENAQNVAVLQNSVYNNFGLGIDLGNDGINNNDSNDTDSGPNNRLNFPEYTSISELSGDTNVEYNLDVPSGNYRIEFYKNTLADSSGNGEGETYLGFQNVTSSGSLESISHTLVGVTNVTNLAMTTTAIDNNSPTGYGPTSEFGAEGTPIVDLAITKVLDNPEDTALNADLSYTITFTNNGPTPVDIGGFDNSNIGSNSLFNDILPPELSYSGVSGANISCTPLGPGSASLYGSLMANHLDHEIVTCGYTGGTRILTAGQSISATITVNIAADSDLVFNNYVIGAIVAEDPSMPGYTAGFSSGGDLIDYFSNPDQMINNFARTEPYADISLAMTMINPQSVSAGGEVSYQVTLTNKGPQGLDLSEYNNFSKNLLTGLFPAAQLAYANTNDQYVVCSDLGPGSAQNLGPAASNHPEHQLLICGYTGSSQLLLPNESFSFQLNFTANNQTPENFSLYAFQAGVINDPDVQQLNSIFSTATQDVLDSLTNDNFARVRYIAATRSASVGSALSATGINRMAYIIVACTLLATGMFAGVISRPRIWQN